MSRQTFLGGNCASGNAVLACRAIMREIKRNGDQCSWGKISNIARTVRILTTGRASALQANIMEGVCDGMIAALADGCCTCTDYSCMCLERTDKRARRTMLEACGNLIAIEGRLKRR